METKVLERTPSVEIEVMSGTDPTPKKRQIHESYQMRLEQLTIESKQFWLSDQFVDRPGTVLSIGYAILILAAVISFYFGYFTLETPGNPREFLIWRHKLVEDWDLQTLSRAYIEKFQGGQGEKQLQTQYDIHVSFGILYQHTTKGGHGLLEKEHLLRIQEAE